jgi:hypothetical protein
MMRCIRAIAMLLAALGTLLATPAFAWGSLGHRTVAAIAWANVRPQTRTQLAALLRQTRVLNTPECAVRTLAEASTWADCVRKDGDRFRFASRWHFQDEDICRPYDSQEGCADGNCVTAQINRDRKLLGQPSRSTYDRAMALMFLVHFVGDIHQPLHSADHARDKGGNDLLVTGGQYDGFNMHELWDVDVAQAAISGANWPMVRGYSDEDKARFGAGEPTDWGRESWDLARKLVYPAALAGDPCRSGAPRYARFDADMLARAAPVARTRLVQAGLRLARVLDEALGQ